MGSNETSSTSRPVSTADRADAFDAGWYRMSDPKYTVPIEGYKAPQLERAAGGDYDRLERSIVDSRTAPINRAWDLERESINQEMADRGLWASGVPAQRMQQRFEQAYMPAFKQAGAEAAQQRYGLEADERARMNQAALDIANREYDSRWRPLDYKSGIWNNTGGVVSSSTGGGWSI